MGTEQLQAEEPVYRPGGLTSVQLKWIAVITMFIDHIGASLLEWMIVYAPAGAFKSSLRSWDMLLRYIGRLAFPIYIFLMVEGFFYTRSRKKYFGRLLLFAAISEFPFDLAFFLRASDVSKNIWWRLDHQNVFFTLAIGFLAMWVIETLRPREWKGKQPEALLRILACVAAAYLACRLANFLHTDYSWKGVLAMELAYLIRLQNLKDLEIFGILAALLRSSSMEIVAIVDFFLFRNYHGEKGRTVSRWFFYIFYPAHLLLLGTIRVLFILPR